MEDNNGPFPNDQTTCSHHIFGPTITSRDQVKQEWVAKDNLTEFQISEGLRGCCYLCGKEIY